MAGFFAWLSRSLDPGHDIDELARRLDIDVARVASQRLAYRTFRIPKRSGGWRQIEAPEGDLKHVQRKILRRVLTGLKTHPCAIGFERGKSIVTHAREHTGQRVVIRLDLVAFFPSTRDKTSAFWLQGRSSPTTPTVWSRKSTGRSKMVATTPPTSSTETPARGVSPCGNPNM